MNFLTKILFAACLIWFSNSFTSSFIIHEGYDDDHVQSTNTQTHAVRALLKRLIPDKAHLFHVTVDSALSSKDKDVFKIDSKNDKIYISGNKGYSAAYGLQYFLKKYCNCHISWSGNQLNLPNVLPVLPHPKIWKLNDKYRYYMNVCTFSYSTVSWNWTRWEKEIDWMALNGINLPLAFTGQEMIWKQVFKLLGLTQDDIDAYFTGPYFLAWNRMGNIQSWAGPLSDNWIKQKAELQHRILLRMRSFGMTPVLPAFNGRIPSAIKRIYPNASISYSTTKWGHFDAPYTPVAFLEPADPLFEKIAEIFLEAYTKEFGTNHIYNIDLFNEMLPSSNDTSYLSDCAKSVYHSLIKIDEKAIWLTQGWMFYNDQDFWTLERAEAFLTSVPLKRMIVLDLQAELYPQYIRLNSYFGQPFIWCMLHNYGGVLGLYGSIPSVNTGVFDARTFNGSTMIGTGITPEGIETNDVVYELMNEMALRKKPVHLEKWVAKYSNRRYGFTTVEIRSAWRKLIRSVYNAVAPFRNHGKYILSSRPSLKLKPYIWYNRSDVFDAWKLFIESPHKVINTSHLFAHDLVDLTRQGLQLIFDFYYEDVRKSYQSKDWNILRNTSDMILELYDDFETLLASDVHFLLGTWLNSAKEMATNLIEWKQYNYNARNQITLWGPTGQIRDYANKQWSGVVEKYFRRRWLLFTEELLACVRMKIRFNQTKYNFDALNNVEIPFTVSEDEYPVIPSGDPIEISRNLFKKYEDVMKLVV